MTDIRDYSNEEQLLTLLEDQEEQILVLSSENSILKSEIQKKSEMIVSLNEQIGKLSESDRILQKSEQLKRDAIALQNQTDKKIQLLVEQEQKSKEIWKRRMSKVNEFSIEIQNAFAEDRTAARKARTEAERYREEQQALLRNEKYRIDKLAEQKVQKKKELLEKRYRERTKTIEAKYKKQYEDRELFHWICLGTGIISLVIQLVICMI